MPKDVAERIIDYPYDRTLRRAGGTSTGGGGGGATSFLGLSDTISSYSGLGEYYIRVKATEDGLEAVEASGSGYTQEEIEDFVGAQFAGNTGVIDATYNDTTGAITLTLDVSAADRILYSTAADTWAETTLTSFARTLLDDADVSTAQATLELTQEHIEDIVGAMVSSNTETNITVTYDDANGKLNFVVSTDTEAVQDIVGAMVSSNTETGISVTYDDASGKLNFDAQTAGDARYGRLGAANSWTDNQSISSTATSGSSLSVTRNLAAASTDSPVVNIHQDNSGDDQPALQVRQDGSGNILQLLDGANTVLVVTDDGRMGIGGTPDSNAPLHVRGSTFAIRLERTTTATTGARVSSYLKATTTGSAEDGFGPAFYFEMNDAETSGLNEIGRVGAVRDGADNNGAVVIYTYLSGSAAERMRITSAGLVGIGTTSPQGRLHVHDGIGGHLHVSVSGVEGSAVELIPNGTGDVTANLRVMGSIKHSGGNSAGVSTGLGVGAEIPIYDSGGNTLTLRVNSDGSVDVRRTAGSGSFTVTLLLVWN